MPEATHLVLGCDRLELGWGDGARHLHVGAAGGEEAAGRAMTRPRRRPWDADERVLPRELGDRLHEAPRIWMRGQPEERSRGADLDEPAAVHDGDAGRERGDHRKVVAHVHGSYSVRLTELADRLENVCLGGHVETGRRLVENDHARAIREGHRERHPLLLPTRELMRVAPKERGVGRQQHLTENLDDPCASLGVGRAEPVLGERLLELFADAHRRAESRGRVLRDIRDQPAAQTLALERGESKDVATLDAHLTASDAGSAARVPEDSQADRRLAGARLTDEAEHLAGSDLEGDLVDDVLVATVVDLYAEVDDLE